MLLPGIEVEHGAFIHEDTVAFLRKYIKKKAISVGCKIRNTARLVGEIELGDGCDVAGEIAGNVIIGNGTLITRNARISGQTTIGNDCTIEGRVNDSFIGDNTKLIDNARIIDSVLLPFLRTEAGQTNIYNLLVRNARVEHSLILGGTEIFDDSNIRRNCMVGPFVHLGHGSELKASTIIGCTPKATVEIPHRSYLGNAVAIALYWANEPCVDDVFIDLAGRLEALFFGKLTETRQKETGITEGFHPMQTLLFEHNNESMSIDVEGINLGALFTTSNFDPRHGGTKWPTIIQAGFKAGITSMAQAPVVLPFGALLGSGCKAKGNKIKPQSIIITGIGKGTILEGYLERNREILGSGIAQNVEITISYLRMLCSLRVVFEMMAASHRRELAMAGSKGVSILAEQFAEILVWLGRFMELVEDSFSRIQGMIQSRNTSAEQARKLKMRLDDHQVVLKEKGRTLERLNAWLNKFTPKHLKS